MDNDVLLRNLALPIIALGFAGAATYRIRARTCEHLDRRQEGWFILIGLRLFGLTAIGLVLAWLLSPQSLAFSTVQLPLSMRFAGLPVGVASFIWIIWTFHTLGHNLTDTVAVRRNATVVTHGPYQWVRHPFYLGFAGLIVFWLCVTANLLIVAAALAAFGMILLRIPMEERKLVEHFGTAYLRYMERTGRLLPRLG